MSVEEMNNFEMTGDLAEAYRQLREDHVAGSDLVAFVQNELSQASYVLSQSADINEIFRAQGYFEMCRMILARFQQAEEVLADNIERLKP